jgi:hypothetical protein
MVSLLPALLGLLTAQVASPAEPTPTPAPVQVPPAPVVAPAPAVAPAPPPAPSPPTLVPVEVDPEAAPLFRESGTDEFGDATLGGFTLRTLAQVRYRQTFTVSGAGHDEQATVKDNDGWLLNRMFLRMVAAPNKRLQARVLVDFAELMRKNPKRALKSGFAQLDPWKWLQVTAGMFKRSFSLLELLPIADFELSDEGPTDDFLKDLGYAGRDMGVMIRLSPLEKKRHLRLWLGAFAGDAEEGYDASIGKLLTARAESRPYRFLRLGADFSWRTDGNVGHEKYPSYLDETPTLSTGKAYSADLTFSLAGLELRLEGLLGRRTDVLWEIRDANRDFFATWAVVAYRLPVGSTVLMPAVRAEWLDVDRKHSGGGRLYLTAAINLELNANLRLLVDLSRYDVDSKTQSLKKRPWPMPLSGPDPDVRVDDIDWWAVTAQLQLKI